MNQKNGTQEMNQGKTNEDTLIDQAKHAVENVVGNVTGQAREQVTTRSRCRRTRPSTRSAASRMRSGRRAAA